MKIGGSIVEDLPATRALMDAIAGMPHLRLVVMTGGGREVKRIKKDQVGAGLDFEICRMVGFGFVDVRAMLLTAFSPRTVLVHTVRHIELALEHGLVPVLAPGRLVRRFDLFEHSWEITTDSIGLYFAWLLGASQYLVVTDVDGIFDSDPRLSDGARLLDSLHPNELRALGGGKVDRYFADYLSRYPVSCSIANGRYPDRIRSLLNNERVPATIVTAPAEGSPSRREGCSHRPETGGL